MSAVTTDSAATFAALARALCATPPSDALDLLRALTALRAAALHLEPAPFVDDGEVAAAASAPAAPSDLPFDFYGNVPDPHAWADGVPQATLGSLVDDVADIRADLQEGLALYEQGHVAAAVEAWHMSFWSHWGAHAVHAEAALHAHVAGRMQW